MIILVGLVVLVVATVIVTFVAYSTVQALRRHESRQRGPTQGRGYGLDPDEVHRRR